MDLYEQLVEWKLTIFEQLAVIPQFPVLFDENGKPWSNGHKLTWSAYPDFLALDVKQKHAYIVEVSKSLQSSKAKDLVARMKENRGKIEEYVSWFAPEFDVHWRFFVREIHTEPLRGALSAEGVEAKVEALECVFEQIKSVMP